MGKVSINVARMYYPVKTLGPGNRMGIWLAGCPRNCSGCISPDFRSESAGRPIEVERLMEMIRGYLSGYRTDRVREKETAEKESREKETVEDEYRNKEFVENKNRGCGVTISGGEPFLQAAALKELVREIRKYTEDIIIFTGYLYEELIEKKDDDIDDILSMTGMLVDGPYIDELNDGTGMRGSSNQRFIILNHLEYYDHPENWKRAVQGAVYGNKIITMGIPDKI